MHEMAITQSVVDAVVDRLGDARVCRVRLEIGRLSGVVPDSVRFCFDVLCAGTSLDGAELDIDEPPGRARCRSCGGEFGLDDPILLCPCGSADAEVLAGRELRIMSVEVASHV
ncbi:hydrogenase maturation nickel metallochaperone HypA [Amycolatopsis rubida]|uniref:Hydrogenase maturation factor HypA n=1 Tax=Amycolatopsis rubida TaxID=112413 RepID=A0A1I5SE51_9PSEU|nr:hydrogenase maturation nickel metallochaperone HypA [Amycolatopsis rubida]SFP69034.1 hydrogenase nickel incorporation protein HypA/HybF [Amycolatopsis rubida]